MSGRVVEHIPSGQRGIQMTILFISIFMFLISSHQNRVTLLLWSCAALWLHNVLFSSCDIKTRYLFLMFHLTFFLFILGRPLLSFFRGENLVTVQRGYGANLQGVLLSLKVIYCSLFFVWIGNRIIPLYRMHKEVDIRNHDEKIKKLKGDKTENKVEIFRLAVTVLLITSFIASFILGIEKLVYIINHSYLESYINFHSKMPYFIYVISSFFEYTVFFYLATFPDKKKSILCMLIYIISEVPSLLGGQRNPICLAILFCIIYVIIRHFKEDGDSWISKRIIIIGAAGLFFGMILMGVLNYSREGTSLGSLKPFLIIEDLIYRQGVTFSWICTALSKVTLLRSQGVISYTFGGLIDYVCHNKFAQIMFGASPLARTNSLQMAKMSNDMSHHLSHLVLGEKYLQGHGTGTSYLMELFIDFGWTGIIIFSALLGLLFFYSQEMCFHTYATRVFLFCSINGILFMPRGTALDCVSFLWRISFWCSLLLCLFLCFMIDIVKRKRGN